MKNLLLVVALLLPLLSCHNNAAGMADIVIDGRGVLVEPYLARDFMPPVSPADGSPLAVYVKLSASDSLPLPRGLVVDHTWVVKGFATWGTDMLKDESSPEPWSAEFRGFGGPKWGPNIRVDVSVRIILPNGDSTSVRIPRCLITRSM